MKENQFLKTMREESNEKLIEILNVSRMDYTPEAIEAVEKVLNERGVSYEKKSNESLQSEAMREVPVAEMAYASGWKRCAEYIIDYIVIYVIMLMVMFMVILNVTTDEGVDLFLLVTYLLVYYFYYFVFEQALGKTIGKMLLRTTVVDLSGGRPKKSQIVWRSLYRFIPYEAFSFLFGGWKEHKLSGHWHDSISKTYVVDDKKISSVK